MPGYAVGPPAKPVGPIVDVYADGGLERGCGNCSAVAGAFCRRADGSFKPVPCCARLRGKTNDLRHVTEHPAHPRTSGGTPE